MPKTVLPLLLLVAAACNGEPTYVFVESDTDVDTDTDTDTDADTDVDTDTDTDVDTDTDADTDVEQCDDDTFEPELDLEAEPPEEEGFSNAVQMSSAEARMLTGTSSEDFWRFTMNTGNSAEFLVEFLHAEGNIDVEIYDSNFDSVLTLSSTDDNEEGTYTAAETGSHYMRVFRSTPGCQEYDFSVSLN